MSVVVAVIELTACVVVLLWLLSMPGDEDEEDLAGFVAANWSRVRR